VGRRLGKPYRRPRWDRSVTGLQPLHRIVMAAPLPSELHMFYATTKPGPTARVLDLMWARLDERSRGATRWSA
ncbi:MAG: hypothetical protein ACRDQZ_20125, partial [Mycobacteriales bacterium]